MPSDGRFVLLNKFGLFQLLSSAGRIRTYNLGITPNPNVTKRGGLYLHLDQIFLTLGAPVSSLYGSFTVPTVLPLMGFTVIPGCSSQNFFWKLQIGLQSPALPLRHRGAQELKNLFLIYVNY
ncbi:MAG: hypothetical protein COZ30_00805 [Candidatus Nealsonbacteria bacterium CG_4_10_14_3_um_filter_36_16]|uniref:Uncharacterized protein n=2 Tax=Parcubacteria group TaxID=1794811 RepID=A0A2M7MFF6_9BACT|nr:MAG: hypothetical protein COV54_03740 [Candidatus Jorgensenbacteria bacterium CG11_big_fil_rev_8_21_14_0_20_38_23]PIX88439.1 MAG: hypothetical protein COZ30_00805 [Candidatus Nealsonbacteria bacterium CG_4_10_14_3_um_filter_36_16]